MSFDRISNCVLFGPMGFWRSWAFGLRLHRAGIWHQVTRRPRAIAVRARDLDQASRIYEEMFGVRE